MIPNICNWFQNSVFNSEIVQFGYVQKQDEWWKNWDFETIEMEDKYKFIKQTEPQHLLMSLHKNEPNGELCMKATKWSVSLVNMESIQDIQDGARHYRYAKLKMLPKTGGWTIAGEGYSDKAWTKVKNMNSGDDNWTVESPVRLLSDYSKDGLNDIALVVNALMKKKISVIFALQKQYNLNHLSKSGVIPEDRKIGENLTALLSDPNQELNVGTTIFQVRDGSWKILAMKTNLAVRSERSASLISKQHDVVCIVLSNKEAKATFWSLGAAIEATSLEEIQAFLNCI